jgi:hypothetical protein
VEQLCVYVLERAHLQVVANAPWCDTLTARDAWVVDLVIEDEADSQMLTTHGDAREVVVADEIDCRLDRIDAKRAAAPELAHQCIENASQMEILAAKVIIDAMDATGVPLFRLCELASALRTLPQRSRSARRSAGSWHKSR